MSARGFKTVGWGAAVGAAALGFYMLSLQVATERNELAKVERQIVAAKQDIRSLQTELGTRGRLSQLERWNADVLALSAPISGQYLEDELMLARFDRPEPTLEDRSELRMAAAPATPKPEAKAAVQAPVRMASAPAQARSSQPVIRQASLGTSQSKPQLRRASLVEAQAAPQDKKAEPKKAAKPVKIASAASATTKTGSAGSAPAKATKTTKTTKIAKTAKPVRASDGE